MVPVFVLNVERLWRLQMNKNNIVLVVLLIVIGSGFMIMSFVRMQPTKAERTIGMINDVAESFVGERINYRSNISGSSILLMVIGAVLVVVGILFAVKNKKNIPEISISETRKEFCPNCGKPLSENNKFCAACGANLVKEHLI